MTSLLPSRTPVKRRLFRFSPGSGVLLRLLPVLFCAAALVTTVDSPQAQSEADRANALRDHDPSFRAQWGLETINAHWAYARGFTGANVTIGIVDAGLYHVHPAFAGAGKVDPRSLLFYKDDTTIPDVGTATGTRPAPAVGNHPGYTSPYAGFYPHREDACTDGLAGQQECETRTIADAGGNHWRIPHIDEIRHGTSVAATAAGRRYDGSAAPHGVAYNANILMVAHNVTSTLIPLREQIGILIDHDLPVINVSLGADGNFVGDPAFASLILRGFSDRIDILEQETTAAAERTVIVWAAGNDHGDPCTAGDYQCDNGGWDAFSPTAFDAGLPYYASELRGHSLAVAAIGRNGRITDFSNRCGPLPGTSTDPDAPPAWNAAVHGRHYCLVAPGEEILAPTTYPRCDIDSTSACAQREIQGTSFAAPMVAGAFAVLVQRFTNPGGSRAMGNTAITQRMLETANRRGTYADDCAGPVTGSGESRECTTYSTIYGAGLLDLKAATEPVGMSMTMMGSSLQGRAVALSETILAPGTAYGDAFRRAFSGTHLASFDDMLFPFWMPLSSRVAAPAPADIYARMSQFAGPPPLFHLGNTSMRMSLAREPGGAPHSGSSDSGDLRPSSIALHRSVDDGELFAAWRAPDSTPLGLRESLPTPLSTDAFVHPFLAFARDGLIAGGRLGSVSAAALVSRDTPIPAQGIVLAYDITPVVSVQTGMLNEKGGALGLQTLGAFGNIDSTTTAFGGFILNAPVASSWSLVGHAHVGAANPDGGGIGLVKNISSLAASAFSVGLAGRGILSPHDGLTIALSQPLRVERGRASLTVPVGRTPEGALLRRDISASLEPSGREISLSAAWTTPLHQDIRFRFATGVSRHPGHNQAASPAAHALADVAFRF